MTPKELKDFWTEAEVNGNGIENNCMKRWFDDNDGPNLASIKGEWRVKPKRKIIDLTNTHFDVEWFNGNKWIMARNGKFDGEGSLYPNYIKYRIRQNHIHHIKESMMYSEKRLSQDFGLPEGLKISVFYNKGISTGIEVLGCLDGWFYEWEDK